MERLEVFNCPEGVFRIFGSTFSATFCGGILLGLTVAFFTFFLKP